MRGNPKKEGSGNRLPEVLSVRDRAGRAKSAPREDPSSLPVSI
jgi:hypothetical protein